MGYIECTEIFKKYFTVTELRDTENRHRQGTSRVENQREASREEERPGEGEMREEERPGRGRQREGELEQVQDREGLQELGRGLGPGGHESPKDNPPAADGPVGDGDVGQEGAVGDKGEAAGCRTGGLGRRREGTVGELWGWC